MRIQDNANKCVKLSRERYTDILVVFQGLQRLQAAKFGHDRQLPDAAPEKIPVSTRDLY